MNKVAYISPVAELSDSPRGDVSAWAAVEVTGFGGERRTRRVKLGTMYHTTVNEAHDMVQEIREKDPNQTTIARFTVNL